MEFKICLPDPYKLCDYRPVYGQALSKYINKYEFWGFCDLDEILGDLGKFINDKVLDEYDKIYHLGHMTLIRNNNYYNRLWHTKHFLPNAYRYDEAFKTPYPCNFDEEQGITRIFESENVRTYNTVDFADLDYSQFNFFMLGNQKNKLPLIFEWEQGKLYFDYLDVSKQIKRKEVAYVHLQKRHMTLDIRNWNNHYLIVPNSFIAYSNVKNILSDLYMGQEYKEFTRIRRKEIITRIKKHAIQQRIYRKFFKNLNRKLFLNNK